MLPKIYKILLTILLLVFLGISQLSADDKGIVAVPSSNLAWEITEDGVGFAPLISERFNEAYMAMVKLSAGLISPAHAKTANMFGGVISGTITHHALGSDLSLAPPLGEGAFYKIAAGVEHVSKCISEIDSVTFLYQDGKFDFNTVNQ